VAYIRSLTEYKDVVLNVREYLSRAVMAQYTVLAHIFAYFGTAHG